MATKILHRFAYSCHRLRTSTVATPRLNEPIPPHIRFSQQQPKPKSDTSSQSPSHSSSECTSSPPPATVPSSTIPESQSSPHPRSDKNQPENLRVTSNTHSFIKFLEKRFPVAMMCIQDFYSDLRRYSGVVRKVKRDPKVLRQLSRKDLEVYQSMPQDMVRLAPCSILLLVPFGQYIVLPIVYKFPHHLLSSHFWTLQQRVDFALQRLNKRLLNQRIVFRGLQLQLESGSVRRDPQLYGTWCRVLAQLGSAGHPRPEDVIKCLPLFCGDPYHLDYLVPTHVNALLRLHGMHTLWRRRKRLADHASILHEIDLAVIREGLECLSQDELRSACFLRGLNPVNVRNEDLRQWLSQWLQISTQIDESSLSLLLHCPVLLAYNKPSNWALFH